MRHGVVILDIFHVPGMDFGKLLLPRNFSQLKSPPDGSLLPFPELQSRAWCSQSPFLLLLSYIVISSSESSSLQSLVPEPGRAGT